MRILIVHHDTLGLAHDARVLSHAIKQSTLECRIARLLIPKRMLTDYRTALDVEAVAPLAPFDCTVILEHAHANPPLFDRGFSRSICYVPNMEWLNAADEIAIKSGAVDHVWLKNAYSYDLFTSCGLSERVRTTRYVGWSSEDIGISVSPAPEKNFDRFLHVKGTSEQKQTDVVMETWADHPEFPELVVAMHGSLDLTRPLSYGPNVSIHHRKLEPSDLQLLQISSGVHVIPSGTEGFGHALNESRAVASVLITADAPPMNGFVRQGTDGMVVAVDAERATPWGRSRFFPISRESLAATVSRLLSRNVTERQAMGQAARQAFVVDRLAFEKHVAACLAEWK
jgi:hypothetical protein